MYVLAGKLKRRKLSTLKSLRITESRTKKVLHSLLADQVEGKFILDLFAGIGSLGIEALSWGAKQAAFVDINKSSLAVVKKNLSCLGLLDSACLYRKDALKAIEDFGRRKERFDLIFLDPPYHKGLLTKALKCLEHYDIVMPSSFIVSLGWYKEIPENIGFNCIFKRRYGDRLVMIFTPLEAK